MDGSALQDFPPWPTAGFHLLEHEDELPFNQLRNQASSNIYLILIDRIVHGSLNDENFKRFLLLMLPQRGVRIRIS